MTATGTTAPPAPSLEEIKVRQQKMWSSGAYDKIAWITVPVAEHVAEAVALRPGAQVLDVATGTGHVALAAARRFCQAVGIDYVPELLDHARRRAAAEGLDVVFEEGDAENLPSADDAWDYVLSSIGVMFAPDHRQTAAELVRVCAPGGVIGVASWTPGGFVGQMLKTVGAHVPPPPGVQPPPLWGTEDHLRELFGDAVHDLRCSTHVVAERFPSPAYFADFFIEHYGPTLKAHESLDEPGRRAFRDDLVALAERFNTATDGTFAADWEYLIGVATRR